MGLAGVIAPLPAQTPPPDKTGADIRRDDLFGPDKLWTIHIKLGAKEWQSMQPRGGTNIFGKPPAKDAPKKFDEPRELDIPKEDLHKSKINGMEFAYVKGDLEFAGKTVSDVAIRFKGNATYMASANGPRRPFKIDVNHYVEDQKIHGLAGLNLGNNALDGTRLRDALAYSVFRSASVPAPRTAFIKLYLTVAGKYDKQYAGVYTLIESVDKPFLRRHFESDKGMLLKPERVVGLPYFGENWTPYNDRYNPRREPSAEQKKRLIEFTRLVNRADTATFQKKIGDYLDVDAFLRFMAANSLVANVDSFFGTGHNYFLYLDAKTNRFTFIPWDLDLSLGNFAMAGSTSDQAEWTISQPYLGKNRLAERILAMKEHKDAYRDHLRKLTETAFAPKVMNPLIADMEKTVRSARERAFPMGGFGMGGNLRQFVAKRSESVLAQLEGKSEGKQLTIDFTFGQGKGPPGIGPKK